MLTDYLPWIIAGVVVLALVVGWFVLGRVAPEATAGLRLRRPRPPRDHFRTGEEPRTPLKRAGVVVNPTKFADLPDLRQRVTSTCLANGWGEPMFYETTIEDPGQGQAAQAVRDGADIVCSLGGDGTVRNVASALVGTETPLGILPAGTGNLLARNLDLPVALETAVAVALTGRNRRIDVGELVVGAAPMDDAPDESGAPETHYFLVMSGLGMDAQIMAGTNENLKAKVGWPAYMLSGLKHLVSPEFRISVKVDDELEFRRRARMVIIGNCGRLLGGLVLMPNARVDDGRLDAVIASPKGVVGWVPVATRVATRQRKGHPTLDHKVVQQVRVRTDRPLPVQIDGDVVGEATEISATVLPASLTVRVRQT
ncbi:diacylglycerol/lipid kinase family protein [Terrabacter sp. GCM10028922]|uniref:diacylglycerol/lipid kinase family protein n=1 Tax=Terrabacter sp. GCM10028922 TaxID=3273428 RepID=UPI003611AC5D